MKKIFPLVVLLSFSFGTISSPKREIYYTVADFEKVPKIDEHFHFLTKDKHYMEFAVSQNFKLISPIWEGEYSIYEQLEISRFIEQSFPKDYTFFGAFSTKHFLSSDFAEKTIEYIKELMKEGASGIKIWKNIGMELKDTNGKYVMIDDPKFEPIFTFLEKNKIPVIGHLGDPKDSWLPVDEMMDPSNVKYFGDHPQYYMYLHPEMPSYEEQISARDNVLRRHLDLEFIGAHLGSLEWSLDELSKRLDSFPNLKVDLAARMYYLRYFSKVNRERVRGFMIKYQDRILYGTDGEFHGVSDEQRMSNMRKSWLKDWTFLATDSASKGKGLQLPKDVIDKIYYKNAIRYFKINSNQ